MALESCKVIILSRRDSSRRVFFCVRKDNMKTDGWSNFKLAFPTILNRPLEYPVDIDTTTDLMPINLVKFNTEMEN